MSFDEGLLDLGKRRMLWMSAKVHLRGAGMSFHEGFLDLGRRRILSAKVHSTTLCALCCLSCGFGEGRRAWGCAQETLGFGRYGFVDVEF